VAFDIQPFSMFHYSMPLHTERALTYYVVHLFKRCPLSFGVASYYSETLLFTSAYVCQSVYRWWIYVHGCYQGRQNLSKTGTAHHRHTKGFEGSGADFTGKGARSPFPTFSNGLAEGGAQ